MRNISNDFVCVVGIGCVLPGAENVEQFECNLINSKCFIKNFPDERMSKKVYLDKTGGEDKTYSDYAGFVNSNILNNIISKWDMNNSSGMELLSFEAAMQAYTDYGKNKSDKSSVILGCMTPDANLPDYLFKNKRKDKLISYLIRNDVDIRDSILKKVSSYMTKNSLPHETVIRTLLTNSITEKIMKKCGFTGENFLVDAACASSLTAIDISINRLLNHTDNIIISGGVGANLCPESFVSWSKLGGMSKKICKPFDIESDGINQGEGATCFVLKRLSDALKDNDKIYCVFSGIGSSSDGRSTSIFSPTISGQVLAYEKAYEFLNYYPDYVEAHGTGTIVGDSMEFESLSTFFKNHDLYIGSAKSLLGHTKGAAGSVGLLKAILMIKNKKFFPSSYIKKPMGVTNPNITINVNSLDIKKNKTPIRIGVSSFGFGGINYHLVVDEFNKDYYNKEFKEKISTNCQTFNKNKVYLIKDLRLNISELDLLFKKYQFKFPFASLEQTDKSHIMAMTIVKKILYELNLEITDEDKKNVKVFSSSILGLDSLTDLGNRLRTQEFTILNDSLNKKEKEILMKFAKEDHPTITEDTVPGILNNIIVGRVCNMFDFKGKSYNIDSDFNSKECLLKIIYDELSLEEGFIFHIQSEDSLNEENYEVIRGDIVCSLYATKKYLKKYLLKPIKILDGVTRKNDK